MAAPMMALDFRRDLSRWRNAGSWLLLAGLCGAILAGTAFFEANRQLLKLKREAAELSQASLPPTAETSESDKTQLATEIRHAEDIIRQLSLAWDNLFLALESSAADDMALLSIQPDASKQTIRITGEARDMDAMLGCVARLRRQKPLAQVILTNHEIKAQDPDKPVHFSISAQWAMTR